MGRVAGITAAVGLHLGFLLFGGLLIPGAAPAHATTREVDLLDDKAAAKQPEPEPEATPPPEAAPEQAPDVEKALQAMAADSNDAPELSALSLGAIEQALAGVSGGADFGLGGSLQSGGRIGGTGSGGAAVAGLDDAFSLAEIDQRPRPLFQAQPAYPTGLRGRKIEGVVTLTFRVDANGAVGDARVEKSNQPEFEAPALAAVRQWKFEPAVKGGQRVACRVRQQLRFPIR